MTGARRKVVWGGNRRPQAGLSLVEVTIMLTVLAINAVGDWLRDFLDPRLRL